MNVMKNRDLTWPRSTPPKTKKNKQRKTLRNFIGQTNRFHVFFSFFSMHCFFICRSQFCMQASPQVLSRPLLSPQLLLYQLCSLLWRSRKIFLRSSPFIFFSFFFNYRALPDSQCTLMQMVSRIPRSDLHFTRLIGTGHYGEVWEGRLHGKVVAIKALKPNVELPEELLKKFHNEVNIIRLVLFSKKLSFFESLPQNLLSLWVLIQSTKIATFPTPILFSSSEYVPMEGRWSWPNSSREEMLKKVFTRKSTHLLHEYVSPEMSHSPWLGMRLPVFSQK